ncbi:MAG: glycoside hydrolase family 88 protein [Bacteroidales bacterium]|nr:glycoside hydrolase family 88 protein [Bacteroidales bacterium]
MKKPLILLFAAVLAVSCQESMKQLTDRVFEVAEYQFTEMDKTLTDTNVPKSTRFGVLVPSETKSWTSGFYPGSLWYVYMYTGNENTKVLAEKNTEKLYIETQRVRSHDIGFMVNCSYGNALRITGDEKYREPYINAAKLLTTRFNPTVGLTQSWNITPSRKQWKFPVIIDNMMNLELLTQAHKMSGIDSLLTVAVTHANTTMKNHFRPDYTTWHVVDYDPETGDIRMKVTHQGYSDDSAWSRGQAWAVYGYTMMFREVGDEAYLALAENIARMLLDRLPEDGIPYWDFDSPDIPDAQRDASAGAIMASSFIELAGYTQDKALSKVLMEMAETQIRTLASPEYLAEKGRNGFFLLKHSVGSYPSDTEVNVPLTYADYYFLEALLRYNGKL